MTLEEAVAEIESKFTCVDGPPYAWGPTGEAYVVVSSTIELSMVPLDKAEQTLIKVWQRDFWWYAHNKEGTLYWRVRPEIEEGTETNPIIISSSPTPIMTIYSRLLISSKPITLSKNGIPTNEEEFWLLPESKIIGVDYQLAYLKPEGGTFACEDEDGNWWGLDFSGDELTRIRKPGPPFP